MGYQSEAELENQLIKQLKNQDYQIVQIPDFDALVNNFRIQFFEFNREKLNNEPLTDKEWDRFLNYMLGRTVYDSAKVLRDKYVFAVKRAADIRCQASLRGIYNNNGSYWVPIGIIIDSDLFCDYYSQWITVYNEGTIRKVTLGDWKGVCRCDILNKDID